MNGLEWGESPLWVAFGLLGNVAFGSRFILQWIASERAGASVVPVAFWYLSIVGAAILLIYAIHLRNVVFTLAYLPNAFIYLRNLALLRKQESDRGSAESGS